MAILVEYNVGTGLVDFMITDQEDSDGTLLPNFGVYNDEEDRYKNFENENTIPDAMYLMKANAQINTQCYSYVKSQMESGKLSFLVDENEAKSDLMSLVKGKEMSPEERADYLRPYVMTSILRDQMMNLIVKDTENQNGMNITLTQYSKTIKKDKFSALMYAMYWCKLEEDQGRGRKDMRIEDLFLFN